jgi:hypothetical protein
MMQVNESACIKMFYLPFPITPPIQYYDLVTFDKFKPNLGLDIYEIIGLKFENHNFQRELKGISIC